LTYRAENLSLREAAALICELTGMENAQAEAEIAAAGRDGAFVARAEEAVESDGFLHYPLPTFGGFSFVPARFWGFTIGWRTSGLSRGHEWATAVTVRRADILKVWGPAANEPAAKGGADAGRRKRGPRPALANRIEQRMLDDLKSGHVSRDDLAGWTEEALKAEYGASRDTCRKARKAALSKFVGVSATANSDQ
jgi:hypothetical protein